CRNAAGRQIVNDQRESYGEIRATNVETRIAGHQQDDDQNLPAQQSPVCDLLPHAGCVSHPGVIPAKAGIQLVLVTWTPAGAGVTKAYGRSPRSSCVSHPGVIPAKAGIQLVLVTWT